MGIGMGADLRSRMLKLLEEDEEFRYAVAGLIGLGEVLKGLKDLMSRSEEHDRKFNEVIMRLDEHDRKFNEVIIELRELRRDVSEMRSYIERTSLTLEEEAREVIQHRLKRAGISIKLGSLIKPEFEINIYGAAEDLCVIGEVSTRTGARIVDLLDERVDGLRRKYPEHLRPKVIRVIYTLWATEEAVERAGQEGIWIVKATGDLTPMKVVELDSMGT